MAKTTVSRDGETPRETTRSEAMEIAASTPPGSVTVVRMESESK